MQQQFSETEIYTFNLGLLNNDPTFIFALIVLLLLCPPYRMIKVAFRGNARKKKHFRDFYYSPTFYF